MPSECPQCSKPLPEVETLEFRFCPHCGAEITAEPQPLDDAYLTIPPDSAPPQADQRPMDLSPEAAKKISVAGQFTDKTSAPQPPAGRPQPRLKPPDTPPPVSFFRVRSDEKTPLARPAEKVPQKRDHKEQSPTKNRNIVIATLVILVMLVLLLGALFTF